MMKRKISQAEIGLLTEKTIRDKIPNYRQNSSEIEKTTNHIINLFCMELPPASPRLFSKNKIGSPVTYQDGFEDFLISVPGTKGTSFFVVHETDLQLFSATLDVVLEAVLSLLPKMISTTIPKLFFLAYKANQKGALLSWQQGIILMILRKSKSAHKDTYPIGLTTKQIQDSINQLVNDHWSLDEINNILHQELTQVTLRDGTSTNLVL